MRAEAPFGSGPTTSQQREVQIITGADGVVATGLTGAGFRAY
jgi:hypothetical protein